ncbi:hypothetical protein GF325_08720 [Candidatus Bathyarchaeota archaeon]|nr:hypothetical protein [Candidatus Bathyarchaeota archaeon]
MPPVLEKESDDVDDPDLDPEERQEGENDEDTGEKTVEEDIIDPEEHDHFIAEEMDEMIDDGESLFDSEDDLQEIFSAMNEVREDEEKLIQDTVEKIESGQSEMEEQLGQISEDLADKIQMELQARGVEQQENFVTEEQFIKDHKNDLEKIWYHCLFFLVFNSEDGTATKKGLYESLKFTVSKSPIDPIQEHMFNFGLSALIKIQLYDKAIVSFKGGTFTLQVDRKKMQELLLAVGRPLSKRPVITEEEEQDMFDKFFNTDELL